jgi:hypothetical protein
LHPGDRSGDDVAKGGVTSVAEAKSEGRSMELYPVELSRFPHLS